MKKTSVLKLIKLKGYAIKFAASERTVDAIVLLKKNIFLDCVYSGNDNITQTSWFKKSGSSEEKLCLHDTHYGTHIPEKYKKRVILTDKYSSSQDKSIILVDTSEEDIGTYICYISTFPGGTLKKIISVQKDGFNKLRPSSHHTFMEHQNVTLHFQCTLKGIVKQVTLVRVGDDKVDAIAFCGVSLKANYAFDYKERVFVDCFNMSSIVLFIPRITKTDGGLYLCTFYTDIGNHSIVVNLQNQKSSLFAPFVYGGCTLVALVVAGIIITFVCITRKSKSTKSKVELSNLPMTSRREQAPIEDEHLYANFTTKTRGR
ncbi:CD226 antigen [Bombina bombina]|uniref:CD226 antigen n=1 Tax=Bombina bombina TaxID=8345 RepID=UPI00235A5F44|nr:CD226 antigen [Bombina bombina]